MATCHFCGREFRNKQGVRAHLRHCGAYLRRSDFEKGDQPPPRRVSPRPAGPRAYTGRLPKAELPKAEPPAATDLITVARKLVQSQALRVESDRLFGVIRDHGLDPVRRLEALARWEAVIDEWINL